MSTVKPVFVMSMPIGYTRFGGQKKNVMDMVKIFKEIIALQAGENYTVVVIPVSGLEHKIECFLPTSDTDKRLQEINEALKKFIDTHQTEQS